MNFAIMQRYKENKFSVSLEWMNGSFWSLQSIFILDNWIFIANMYSSLFSLKILLLLKNQKEPASFHANPFCCSSVIPLRELITLLCAYVLFLM